MSVATPHELAWTDAELGDPAALSARLKQRGVSLDAEEVVLLTRLLGRALPIGRQWRLLLVVVGVG